MLDVKLILCPVDFSEFSERAYRHALSLAEHYRARLVALHVVDLLQFPSVSFAASAGLYDECCQAVREAAREQLQEFAKNHARDDIQPELVVQQGTAADSILSFADIHKTDVIVMGTHGRRGYDRLMLGSVTDRVMRRASCPVLAVCRPPHEPEATGKDHPAHHLHRILFCTDFSENSERALIDAISVTAEYDGELTLLHVLEDAVPGSAKAEEDIAAAALDKLIPPEQRKTLKVKTAVRIGKPYRQIIQLALETQVDLVVMGVHGRGALDLAVFGSTTYRVMQLGPSPVLAVHV